MKIMEHEATVLADYYAKQIQKMIADGPHSENGGWVGLVHSIQLSAERIVRLTESFEQ